MTQEQTNAVMANASDNAKKIVAGADGAAVSIKGLEKSSKAAIIAMKALAMVGNMMLVFAVSELVNVIASLANSSESLQESASQIGEKFKSSSQDITDYKVKIEDLYSTINDGNSSYSDNVAAREELLKIQSELIEKYGDEADAIQKINAAVDGNTNAMDSLTRDQWNELKTDFNAGKGKSRIEKITNSIANIGHGSNFNRMIDEMENSNFSLLFSSAGEAGTEQKYKKFLSEVEKISGSKNQSIHAGTVQYELSGNLNEVYDQMKAIRSLADSYDIDEKLMPEFSSKLDDVKSKLDDYKEIYSQHILYDKILKSDDYTESFNDINKAYDKYKEAFKSGDKETISSAKEVFAKAIQEATNGLSDKSVVEYFRSMYPDLQQEVGTWTFTVDFQTSDKLREDVENAASKFSSSDELYSVSQGKTGTEEQKNAYVELKTAADHYGLSLDQLIVKLEQLGILIPKSKIDLAKQIDDNNKGFTNSDETERWVKGLSDDDANIVKSQGFQAELDKQKNYLHGAKLAANDYAIALQNVKDKQNTVSNNDTKIDFNKKFKTEWANLDNITDDDSSLKNTKSDLMELATTGELTIDTFQKVTGSSDFLQKLGISEDEIERVIEKINNLANSADQLSAMKTGIHGLSEILAQKKENLSQEKTKNVGIGADVLAGLPDDVKESQKEYEEYCKTLGDGSSSMKKCREATNKLATAYVNSKNYLAKLTPETKAYYTSVLSEMGVENAAAVVSATLARKKRELKLEKQWTAASTIKLKDATRSEIDAIADENSWSNKTKHSLYLLALQKKIANGVHLSTSTDIKQLKSLVKGLGGTTKALSTYQKMIKDGGKYSTTELAAAWRKATQEVNDAFDDASQKEDPVKVDVKEADTSSSSGKGSKSGSDKSSSSKQTIDWIERALNRVSSTLDLIKAKAENLFGTNSLKTLQKQEASLKSQYNMLKKQYAYQNKAEKKYLAKANSVKLSSSLKKAVQNGRISGSLKQLIATYGEKTATRIQNYQDYWDKAQDQKKSKEETRKAMRENLSERYQLHIDDADARKSRNEADLENLTTAKSKAKVLKNTLKHIATSYDYQIKQAKLENNDVKVAELKAQKKKEQRETEVQILQNYADEYEATVSLYEAQSSSTTNLTKKNSLLSKSIPVLKNQYDKLIAIAKKEGNITEQKRLQNEYQDKLNEKLKAQFDNVVAEYEYQQTGYQQRTDSINNAVSLSEAKGHYAGKAFYQNLQNSQKDSLKSLEAERDSIIKKRQEAIANGLKLDSEQYREMTKQIWTADRNIEQMNTDIANTAKQIREAKYALDEFTQTRIDERNNEAEFYKTIMGYKDSFDKNGNITGDGLGTLTSDVFEIQNNMAKVEEYKKSLADLDAQYKRGDMGYEEFITKNQSLTESMRDAESQVYSLKDAIKSLIEDGLNKQLDALNELIEKYKKTLDSAKDLREYNKNIAEQTKNITTIQKQLAALNGDTSEEGRARIQKLQVSLKDAKEQLEDTEYDKRMSDIENILTDLTDDFQDFINDQMDHIDGLVDKIITAITVNSGVSGEKIIELAKQLGFTLSDSLLNFIKNGNNTTDKDANAETDKKSQEDSKDAIKQVTDFAKQQLKENNSVAEGTAQANHKKAEEAKKNSGSSTKGSYNFINGGIATKINQGDGKVSYNDIGKKGTLKKGATYYDYALAGGVKKGDKGHTTKAAHAVTIAAIDQNGNAKLKSATKALNGVWIPKSKLKYLQGFSQGGRVGDLQNIVRMNGDDGVTINTLKKGEEVLTPYNADLFDQFVDFLPDLVDYNNNLVDMIRPDNVPATKVRTGDLTLNIDNIELPNVTDPKEFSAGLIAAMQQDKKLQRFWGDATAGSLNNNMSGIYKY